MKLTTESASPLLREYGISTGVTGINTYLDIQNDGNATILARVDVTSIRTSSSKSAAASPSI